VAYDRRQLNAGGGEHVGMSFPVSQLATTPPGSSGTPRIQPGVYRLQVDDQAQTFRVP
jgi:hypothetical protein